MDELIKILITLVTVILTTLVSWAIGKLTSYLDKKIKDEKLKNIINDTLNIVEKSVKETSQTFVEELKKEGKFTKEKQQEAFNKTIEHVKEQLSQATIEYIEKYYNSFDVWLKTAIESKLYDLKK